VKFGRVVFDIMRGDRQTNRHDDHNTLPTYKDRKGKEEYLYNTIYILCISQSALAWITQFYLQITPITS